MNLLSLYIYAFLVFTLISCNKELSSESKADLFSVDIEELTKRTYKSSEGMSLEEKLMSTEDLDIDNYELMRMEHEENGNIKGLDDFDPEPNFENHEIQAFAKEYYDTYKKLLSTQNSGKPEKQKLAMIEIEQMYQKQQLLISKSSVEDAFALNRWMTMLGMVDFTKKLNEMDESDFEALKH